MLTTVKVAARRSTESKENKTTAFPAKEQIECAFIKPQATDGQSLNATNVQLSHYCR